MPARLEKFANKGKNSFKSRPGGLAKRQERPLASWRGTERERLGMVRLATEIRVEDLLAVWFAVVLVGRFDSYEDRVYLPENTWIVESHGPAVLAGIILVEDTQAVGDFPVSCLSAPDMKDDVGLERAWVSEVIGVEHEGFSFDIEHSPERTLPFSVR